MLKTFDFDKCSNQMTPAMGTKCPMEICIIAHTIMDDNRWMMFCNIETMIWMLYANQD